MNKFEHILTHFNKFWTSFTQLWTHLNTFEQVLNKFKHIWTRIPTDIFFTVLNQVLLVALELKIWFSQGCGIVSLVFQVYLLHSGTWNNTNSNNKFSISQCLSLTFTLHKVLRCWWLLTNQILCSKVHDKFPTKVQDYRLAPRFFELCQYPRLIPSW